MEVIFDSFTISDDVSLFLKVLDTESLSLRQETQTAVRARAEWPTFFSARASRSIPLVYPVAYPPCASIEEAFEEARTVLATCPRGGELTEQIGTTLITYADAKLDDIEVRRMGVTNFFTFRLTAVNPSTTALSPLAAMNANYVANLPLITTLTGGTSTALDGQVTTDVAVGFTALVLVTINGVAQPKHFRLIAGTTAENTDPTAGVLVVRPDDYHASTNAKVWVEIS